MVKLTCNCLNIRIHAKSGMVQVDKDSLGINLKSANEFFDQDLCKVILNLEGIQVEHRYLSTESTYNGWIINRCINCRMLTHAQQLESNIVLVNSKLMSDDVAIKQMINSPDYSALFKIVLKAEKDCAPAAIDLALRNSGETVKSIQQQLDKFLQTEESAMEDRIRKFDEKERENYALVQTKARRDKNILIGVVISNTSKSVTDSLVEAMVESPVGSMDMSAAIQAKHFDEQAGRYMSPIISPLTFGVKTIEEETYADEISGDVNPTRRTISTDESDKRKKRDSGDGPSRQKQVQNESGAAVDDVFQYDPGFQEDPSQPFSESESEDVTDTDDDSSTTADEALAIKRSSSPTAVFSTSVPIRVPPSCSRQNSRYEYDDQDSEAVPTDPASMAASIQALARSVHGDGSEIFGELPRSRTRVLSSQSSVKH